MVFENRQQAGRLLSEKLTNLKIKDGVVIGLTRGGVVVAAEVAKVLSLPFDICVIKKLGAPLSPELAIGAVGSSSKPYLDKNLIASLSVDKDYLASEIGRKKQEAARLENIFRQVKPQIKLNFKTVILTDDGIATGASVFAAIAKIKKDKPKKIILAVPIAPQSLVEEIEKLVDQAVVLIGEEEFQAVGQFYKNFVQVEDKQVLELLRG